MRYSQTAVGGGGREIVVGKKLGVINGLILLCKRSIKILLYYYIR